MNETKTEPGSPARLRSLLSVNLPYRSAGDGPERAAADTPAARLAAKYTGKGIRGRPWTNLKKLAQDHSIETLEKIIELRDCDNECVAYGATKLLWNFIKEERRSPGGKRRREKQEKVHVKIRYFGKGKGDAERA